MGTTDAGIKQALTSKPVLAAAGLVVALAVFWLGWLARGGAGPTAGTQPGAAVPVASAKPDKPTDWTCSMHPQIKLPKPGKCPICFMPLIPVGDGSADDAAPRQLKMSAAAKKLAEIETRPVERRFVEAEVRMVGKIDYDETRLKTITAWVGGRLDRLFVDYTGVPVRKGDHLVSLYSPELISAQEELLQSVTALAEKKGQGLELDPATDLDVATVKAAREKLLLLGLTEQQVKQVAERRTPVDHLTIYAPVAGIVIHKNVLEGMYVKTGTRIYTIADLSTVWIKLDAYEMDVSRLRYGQDVEFTPEAYPGEAFHGRIAFIDPVLDPKTRTVKVRVNAPNAKGKLKPEMFVRATVRVSLAKDSVVMGPDLAGKWICPMHPEILKDKPGECDLCQMDLVRTETLEYATAHREWEKPLVIPRSAALVTGKRAVVYVEVPNTDKPTYLGRQVVLGARAGDYYLVKSGLREGERVVVQGNFKIDSALQILARPSMMMPEAEQPAATQRTIEQFEGISVEFQAQLGMAYEAYLSVQQALVRDDASGAGTAAKTLDRALEQVDMKLLKGGPHMAWMKQVEALGKTVKRLRVGKTIQQQREALSTLSEELTLALKRFGYQAAKPAVLMKCPMAFDNRGARWLQVGETVANPYFGSAMLHCGEKVESISVSDAK